MNTLSFIGMQVDQYRIKSHLARGGMADVYIARDVGLDRLVAFKILLNMLAQDDQFVKRFQREAQAVARLDHPNIVKVYSTGLMPAGQPYIAMQYIQGGSMREQLLRWQQQGKVAPAPQSLAITRHLSSALDTAHRAGIVHRDLKPSNVLIRPSDGMPVLVDLGIAAIQGSEKLTQTGSLIGTPHYMSPEQVRGETVDGRSDIYSLGVILYELLTGVRPFEADESIAILHKHVYEAPPPIEQLRPGLSGPTLHVVNTCLQKDPGRRFQTAEGLTNAIDRALQVEGQQGYILKTTVLLPEGEDELISRSRVVRPSAEPAKKKSNLVPLLAAGAVMLFLLFLIAGFLAFTVLNPDESGEAIGESPPPEVVELDGDAAIESAAETSTPTEQPVTATEMIVEQPVEPTLPPATATSLPTETPEMLTPTPDFGPELFSIGRSVNGQAIEVTRFGTGQTNILFVGGIHAGYAPSTVTLANFAINHFTDNISDIPASITLYIVNSLNPDSPYDPNRVAGRLNANGVDLNRNWDCNWAPDTDVLGQFVQGAGGRRPLSEPETQGLADFIDEIRPAAVVFWGASGGVSAPGFCDRSSQTSSELANIYGTAAGYRILPVGGGGDINGDVSNWLDEQGIPTIFAILVDEVAVDWENNLAGMLAVLEAYNQE